MKGFTSPPGSMPPWIMGQEKVLDWGELRVLISLTGHSFERQRPGHSRKVDVGKKGQCHLPFLPVAAFASPRYWVSAPRHGTILVGCLSYWAASLLTLILILHLSWLSSFHFNQNKKIDISLNILKEHICSLLAGGIMWVRDWSFGGRAVFQKKGVGTRRSRLVFLAASPRVTAPPSSLTRLYYNGYAAKSHLTATQYHQLCRLAYLWIEFERNDFL